MNTIYLVTGAAGHLGTTICDQLLREGRKVRALVLNNDPTVAYMPKEVEKIYGDVTNIDSLEQFFANPNDDDLVVIHCAGIVSIASKRIQKVYDVNVTGTNNIIKMCNTHRVVKLIYVSSVHAIPEPEDGSQIHEVEQFDPDKVVGLYAKTKAEATQAVLNNTKNGYSVSVVHPSGIFGPNDFGHSHLTQLITDFYKGKLTACVKGGYDFVDVRDVAKGIISCADKGKNGQCYILSNQYYQIKDVLDTIHEITGKKKIRTILPRWFAKLTAPCAELYYKLKKQPPLFTSYSLYTLGCNAKFSHHKADSELGYRTRPLKATITDTIDWLKKHGRLK